jgi:hypothetical protein
MPPARRRPPVKRPGARKVKVRKHKRSVGGKTPVSGATHLPGGNAKVTVGGHLETIDVFRTPTTFVIHKLPTKPRVIRKK